MVIKRLAANPMWHFARRTTQRYALDPRPGPHPKSRCLPLGHILRDVLHIAENMAEAKQLLNSGKVKVDGAVRKGAAFPAGLMDIVSIDDSHWRILPDKRGLRLHPITEAEAKTKLLMVKNKTHVHGKAQINLHDGRNLLVDKDIYKTGDVLVWDLNAKKPVGHLQFKRGAIAILIGGQSRGLVGRIEDVIIKRGIEPNRVLLRFEKQNKETRRDYAFVVGQDKPVISIPEGERK